MAFALFGIAVAMIVLGVAAAYQGHEIILVERGWAMVIAGTVVATGGFLLLGIAAAVGKLKRAVTELAKLRDRAGRLDAAPPPPPGPGPSAAQPDEGEDEAGPVRRVPPPLATPEPPLRPAPAEHAVLAAADVIPDPPPPSAQARGAEPDAPAVIGTYNSGGNAYVMYADGSIEADTPNGRFRFKSLDELKDFIAAGGEDAGAARPA